jgi:hypothetical protein
MNVSKPRQPLSGFEGRLEAELVKVVTARAAVPQGPQRRAAMRRPAVRAGVLAAGTAGLALGVPALSHSPAAPASARLSTKPGSVHIHTAAFTVDSYTDGTVHVTWGRSQYFQDHAGLQQALRKAGFPVLIKEGVFCKGPQDNGYLDPGGVGPGVGQVMKEERQADGTSVFVFTPSAMPPREELFIGYLSPSQLAVTHGQPGSVERLVPTGMALTCTTQPPPSHYTQSPSKPGRRQPSSKPGAPTS